MVASVEIFLGQRLVDPVIRLRRQHQAAQHRLFGFHRMRGDAQGVDALFTALGAVIAVGSETSTSGHEKRFSYSKAVRPW
ncbi:hypothetical protein D3C71_1371370 [compost metagenome]